MCRESTGSRRGIRNPKRGKNKKERTKKPSLTKSYCALHKILCLAAHRSVGTQNPSGCAVMAAWWTCKTLSIHSDLSTHTARGQGCLPSIHWTPPEYGYHRQLKRFLGVAVSPFCWAECGPARVEAPKRLGVSGWPLQRSTVRCCVYRLKQSFAQLSLNVWTPLDSKRTFCPISLKWMEHCSLLKLFWFW